MEDAYISAIGSRQDPSIFTGVIYSIVVRDESSSDAHTFGFISSKQAGEVFFNAKAYRSVYGKEPLQGSSVFFTALPAAKGKRVERFYASNQIDPSNRCITIKAGGREFKVLVSKYMDFAGKDPVIGDIVTGFIDNDRYILGNPDEDHDARYVLSPAFDDNSAIVQQGQICQTDTGKRTGIVMLHDRKSLAFSFDDFSRCIGGFPRPPKNVYVIADKSKRKVSQFCTFNALVCRQSQFRNFTEPLPDTICKAFKAADSQNIEVFKANLENLSEAIACYKSPDLSLTLKLPAIETLICHKFSDRSVNLGKLKAERIQILQDLIAQSLRVGHFDRAIEYELRLQKLRYEPKELSRLSGIPRWFDPVSAELKDINPLPYPSPWNLCSADAGFSPSHVPAQPAWGLLMQQPHPELKEIPERAWSIDLSAIPRSEARTEASTYYHIKIER
ncbi:MAG: hypothetical protein LHW58_09465 [Candidatus Cloacimonetes bacterium]|nr:hypothetical protein [Candidatus Cloacimonadota bacterium]